MATLGNLPGKVSLGLLLGDSFSWTVEILNPDGSPATVGSNWTAGIYNEATLTLAISVSPASNVLTLSVTGAQTATIPFLRNTYHWYVRDDDNDKTYVDGKMNPSVSDASSVGGLQNANTVTVNNENSTVNVSVGGRASIAPDLSGAGGTETATVLGSSNQSFGLVEATVGLTALLETTANSKGSLAFGFVSGDATISMDGVGSAAFGSVGTTGTISNASDGSVAVGKTTGAFSILVGSSSDGSLAMGAATAANIEANAANTQQFGEGVNAIADTMKIGNAGLQLFGKTGTPGAPTDGMIWVSNNYVYIRSNGATVKIT
jgi:hypothetical protein